METAFEPNFILRPLQSQWEYRFQAELDDLCSRKRELKLGSLILKKTGEWGGWGGRATRPGAWFLRKGKRVLM